jgi:mycoredoxin
MTESEHKIKIYGTTWCGDTRRARQFFTDNHIDYEWIDIDMDKTAAEYVMSVNKGCKSVPTILFADGSILVEPSSYQLKEKFNLK